MSFFGFPKVKWLQYKVRWANVQAVDVKFSQDLTHQKSLKSVNFWQSFSKNNKLDVFGGTVYMYYVHWMTYCGAFWSQHGPAESSHSKKSGIPRIQGQARRGPAGQIPQQIEEARPEDFRQHQYRTQIQEIAGLFSRRTETYSVTWSWLLKPGREHEGCYCQPLGPLLRALPKWDAKENQA